MKHLFLLCILLTQTVLANETIDFVEETIDQNNVDRIELYLYFLDLNNNNVNLDAESEIE